MVDFFVKCEVRRAVRVSVYFWIGRKMTPSDNKKEGGTFSDFVRRIFRRVLRCSIYTIGT